MFTNILADCLCFGASNLRLDVSINFNNFAVSMCLIKLGCSCLKNLLHFFLKEKPINTWSNMKQNGTCIEFKC